jgi:hypothetical protein
MNPAAVFMILAAIAALVLLVTGSHRDVKACSAVLGMVAVIVGLITFAASFAQNLEGLSVIVFGAVMFGFAGLCFIAAAIAERSETIARDNDLMPSEKSNR